MNAAAKNVVKAVVASVKGAQAEDVFDLSITLSQIKSFLNECGSVQEQEAAVRAIRAQTGLEFSMEDVLNAPNIIGDLIDVKSKLNNQVTDKESNMNANDIKANVSDLTEEQVAAAQLEATLTQELGSHDDNDGIKKYMTIANIAALGAVIGAGADMVLNGTTIGGAVGGVVGAGVAYVTADKLFEIGDDDKNLKLAYAAAYGVGVGGLMTRVGSMAQDRFFSDEASEDGTVSIEIINMPVMEVPAI